jgi:biotin-(acetyl-CoA carboxylase) ligase
VAEMNNEFEVFSFRASDGNTVKLEYRESLPSTSALATQYAEAGYPDRYAVFAEKQATGTSKGKSLSENDINKGIFLSCILRPSIFKSQAGPIIALSTLALALALEEHSSKTIEIGWDGCIYCNRTKIGEIFVHNKSSSDNTSYEYLIISFSVKLDEKIFPPRLTDMVRSVFEENNLSVPMIMAKTILNKCFSLYKDLKTPEKHFNNYASKFALEGVKIKYIEKGKKKPARIVGISKEDLSLIIELRDGRKINVHSSSAVQIPNKI